MSSWNPVDLTGDPKVEEQIRQYYNRKKYRNQNVVFTEGIATEPRKRVEFTLDNSYLHKVSPDAMELHNRANSTAWDKYYKGDKVRRRYEEQQKEEYLSS